MQRIAFAFALLLTTPIYAGPIEKACIQSDRPAASSRLCSCIQGVANQSLTGSDQQKAATFFADPHQAQVTRQSDDPGKEEFWLRYKEWTERAAKNCS
ncbi:MAG: hypothetical protein AAF198_02655 [Pseudomonadota bacterium]